jgi:GxxExxY protein
MAETQLGATTADMEDVAHRAIGCGITVHRILGPGFKETIYDQAFCLELNEAGLRFEREKRILVSYKHWQLPGHRVDLIVEGIVLIELKAIPRLRPLHTRQVVSYLKATDLRLGLLMNFNVSVLRDGIRRVVA